MSYYDTMSLEEFINAILQGKDERLVNRCDVPAILTSLEDYDIYDIAILRATLDSSLDALQVHLHSQAGAPASFLPLLKAHLPPPSPLPPALPFWEVMQDLDPKRRSMLPSRLTFSKMRKSASGLSLGASSSWRDTLESRLNMLESKLDDGLADLKKIIEKLEKQQLTQQEQLKEQKEAQKELHKELVQQKNARANDMLQQMRTFAYANLWRLVDSQEPNLRDMFSGGATGSPEDKIYYKFLHRNRSSTKSCRGHRRTCKGIQSSARAKKTFARKM